MKKNSGRCRMEKGCSFTGHRIIKSEHRGEIANLVLRAIEYAYGKGCKNFYAGGAIGFDTIAAKEVIRFRISHPDVRLILMLPCINQDEKWNENDKALYRYTLGEADEIIYISDVYTPTCIKERNMRLAESGDIVIIYVGRRNSGSAQTAAMAERLGKEIYNLYPTLEREAGGAKNNGF